MTFCHTCNFNNLDDSVYCEQCGSNLKIRKDVYNRGFSVNTSHNPSNIVINTSKSEKTRKQVLKFFFTFNYIIFGSFFILSFIFTASPTTSVLWVSALAVIPLTVLASRYHNYGRIGLLIVLFFFVIYSINQEFLIGFIYSGIEVYLLGIDRKTINLFKFQLPERIISL